VRIGFFSNSYKPYISGVTVSMETLAKELRGMGHTVYIVAPSYPGHKDAEPDIIRVPSFPSSYPGFRLAVPVVKSFPRLDIVHAHNPFGMGQLARLAARRQAIPLVFTFHTLFTRYTHHASLVPQDLSKRLLASYLKYYCSLADCIITPTVMVKRSLLAWKVKKRIEVIPTGISLKDTRVSGNPAIRDFLKIGKDAKVLLYVGRLTREKNIMFLVEAFKKLKDTYFIIVGKGPLYKDIERQNIPSLVLAGEVPSEKVYDYCAAADLFVFSSLTETQGLVLAEAKSQGLPIVALYSAALGDAVRSGIDGYLTRRNQDAFLEHVKRLLGDDGLRKKMSLAARQDIAERFSSDQVAKKVETLYNSLI